MNWYAWHDYIFKRYSQLKGAKVKRVCIGTCFQIQNKENANTHKIKLNMVDSAVV